MKSCQAFIWPQGLLTVIVTSLLLGCAGAPPPKPAPQASIEDPATQREQQRDELYHSSVQLLADGHFTAAESALRNFVASYPRVPGAYLNLSLILSHQDQTQPALDMVNRALDINPDMAPALNQRAQLQVELGNIHAAREDYQRAIELAPGYANAHYNLALLYDIYLQDIASAVQHYDRYLALQQDADDRTREWVDHLKSILGNG